MDKGLDGSDLQSSQDSDEGRSLVGKLKKNVSEIISNTPLSKWFRKDNSATPVSTIRRRQDDSEDDDDLQECQPPAKRTKLPVVTKESLCLDVSEVLSPISNRIVKKPAVKHFPEPIAGPSGYQTRQMLNSTPFVSDRSRVNEIASDSTIFKMPRELASKEAHSDSEESTSGYSSGRLGSKEVLSQQNSKQTSPLETSPSKNRSLFQKSSSERLFTNQTSPSNRSSSLSSRNPSFNPSTFTSPSFVDRTMSTKKILNSPFYNGRTIYGGAAAYGRNTGRTPHDIQKALRQSVKIKPVNGGFEKGNLQLGKTARRILDTLEQYSSPVSDAKKIPVASKKRKTEGSLSKFIGANPYTVVRNASNKELHVPSLTDTLKRKMTQQKTQLQDSTEAVRQIATTSSSGNDKYEIPVQREKEKFTSKMKTKITSVRQKMHYVDEPLPKVKLNPISLPIKELPKFDFPMLPPPATTPSTSEAFKMPTTKNLEFTPVMSKPQNEKTNEFRFSAPLVLAEYLKPLKALNNFKFSEPLVKKRKSIHAQLDDQENIAVETNKTKKINGDINSESLIEKFKPKEGTWECSMCLIRNQPEKLKCAACQNPKLKPKVDAPLATPIILKPAGNSWECPTCMIRNKDELQKCAACQENKPVKSSDAFPKLTDKKVNSESLPVTNSLANKFGKPSDSWECPSCMINNKNEVANCLACTALKPGTIAPAAVQKPVSFGSDFKKKSDEWECHSCMVRNKSSADKCQCCDAANPNKLAVSSLPKAPALSFGTDQNATSFNFGVPPASQNAPKTNASLVFGEKREVQASGTATFSFGVPTKEAESSSDKAEPPKSVGLEAKTNEVKPTFTFGSQSKVSEAQSKATEVQSKASEAKSEATPSKSMPTFSFGSASKTEATTAPTFSFGSAKKSEETSAPTFSFGTAPKKSEEPSVAAPTFSFGRSNKTEDPKKINPLLKPGEKLPEKASIAPVGFSFGLPKSPVAAVKSDKPTKRTRAEDDSTPQAKVHSFDLTTNGDVSKFAPQKAVAPEGGFTFSSNISQAKQETPTFKFGSSSAETPKPSNGFSFGSTPAPAFGAKPSTNPLSFASPAQSPGTFSFGKTAESPKPAAFSFSAAPENKSASQFSFAPAKTQPPAFPGFSFSANQKPSFGSSATTENLFGGAPQNPSVNGNFSFGAASEQKTGFSFGASQNMFSFGSGAATTAPGGGFNFGAAAPALDLSSKPSFNFTGGAAIASFSAPPAQEGTSAPQRKIKKAVRRTVR